MNLDEAISAVNAISLKNRGKQLSPGESVAVTAAWEGLRYEEAIELRGENFSSNYISSKAGPDVWRLLSDEFNCRVAKNYFRKVLEEQYNKHQYKPGRTDSYRSNLIGVPPTIQNFVGYQLQVKQCISAVLGQKSIFIDGPQGIGKTCLVAHVIDQIRLMNGSHYEFFIWKSIHYGPVLDDLLADLVRMLDIPAESVSSDSLASVIKFLSKHRCLLVLDEAQGLLSGDKDNPWEQYGEKYKNYGTFFRRVVEEQSISSIVVTSRSRFADWLDLSERGYPIALVHLDGLGAEANQFLEAKQLSNQNRWPEVIKKYRGNPLLLKIIADQIKTIYGGSTDDFLNSHSTVIADPFLNSLNCEFSPYSSMSTLEGVLMVVLDELLDDTASVTFEQLHNTLAGEGYSDSSGHTLEAIRALVDRSLIEAIEGKGKSQFLLSPVIRKYIQTDPIGYVRQKAQLPNE